MNRITLLLIALGFICSPTIAQSNIDSLKQILIQEDPLPDTSRYQVILKIAKLYRGSFEVDSALVYYNILLEAEHQLADELRYLIYSGKGVTLYYRRNYKSAIQHFEKALEFSTNPTNELGCYQNISSAYIQLGDLNKALAYAQQSLSLSRAEANYESVVGNLNNIGNIHYDNKSQIEAIKYYTEAVLKAKLYHRPDLAINALNGIGISYKEQGEFDKAIPIFLEVLHLADSLQDFSSQGNIYNNLGLTYFDKKNFKLADSLINVAHIIYSKLNDIGGVANTYGDLGKLRIAMKDYKRALKYCMKSYQLNKADHYVEGLVDDCACLYLSYKSLKQPAQALAFHEEWKTNSDSLYSAEKARAITRASLTYEFENEKAEMELMQLQKETKLLVKNKLTQSVAVGLGIIALLAMAFFWNTRRKNKIITQQKTQLEQLNQLKDRIFAIIGHDLRKPAISFRGLAKKVSYLIRKNDFETLKEYGSEIEENAMSLNKLTDNLLSWALMQRNVMPYNPIKMDIAGVANDVTTIFKGIAEDKALQITNNIPEGLIAYVDRTALTTIITNLVDNAIKYTHEGGEIKIDAQQEADYIKISVSDTGTGMDKEKIRDIFLLKSDKSKLGTKGEKGTGLGLHLVKELVELNKGTIKIISEIGKGSSFDLLIPKAV